MMTPGPCPKPAARVRLADSGKQRRHRMANEAPKAKRERLSEGGRGAVVDFVRARDKTCQAGALLVDDAPVACGGPLDVHELKPRGRGGNATNPLNCLVVCRRHHDVLHRHPDEAHEAGLLLWSWEPEPGVAP